MARDLLEHCQYYGLLFVLRAIRLEGGALLGETPRPRRRNEKPSGGGRGSFRGGLFRFLLTYHGRRLLELDRVGLPICVHVGAAGTHPLAA